MKTFLESLHKSRCVLDSYISIIWRAKFNSIHSGETEERLALQVLANLDCIQYGILVTITIYRIIELLIVGIQGERAPELLNVVIEKKKAFENRL